MKVKTIFILGILSMLVSSCILTSLFPLYKVSDLIRDDRIVGSWSTDGEEIPSDYWTFEWLDTADTGGVWFAPDLWSDYNTGNTYRLIATEDSLEQEFIVHLFELGGKTYIDFYPTDVDLEHGFLGMHMVPVHNFSEIEITDDKLIFRWFDPDFFADLIEQNKIKISHIDMNGAILITASTDELQKFVKKYGSETINYAEPDTIPRIIL